MFILLALLQCFSATGGLKIVQIRPAAILMNIKLFWTPKNGTVSKFPPIIEYFVQRIQAQNSHYVHEDLSRPPTWEKPVYTLSPAEQLTAYQTVAQENVTQPMPSGGSLQQVAEEGVTDVASRITTTKKTTTTKQLEFEYEELEETTEKFFEIISTTEEDEARQVSTNNIALGQLVKNVNEDEE